MRRSASALVLALVACGAHHEDRGGATTMAPALRIVDALPPSLVAGVAHGADVTIAHDTRRTVAAAASQALRAKLQTLGGLPLYEVDVPPVVRTWGTADFVRPVTVQGRPALPTITRLDVGPPTDITLAVSPVEQAPPFVNVLVRAAPGANAYDTETSPFRVPDGAVLTFSVGLEILGAVPPMPAEASITIVEDDTQTELWRRALSSGAPQWQDERLALDAYAGRTVRLRFFGRAAPPGAGRVQPVFAEPTILAPRRVAAPPTNVVLISMDTLRARSLGAYGCERATSPTMDAIARDGTLFENAFSTAAFTLPGHMSMLTGLWFRTHRAFDAFAVLSPAHRTLAERLQDAGYATAAFTSGGWIMPWLGFRRGFDVFHEPAPATGRPAPPGGLPYEAFTLGLDWMRTHRDRPFFVFLHNYTVHLPYAPPFPYDELFDAPSPFASKGERLRLEYEREVRYADDQVAALLDGIDALGLRGRTLVILTADHGEAFGEHGKFEHTYDTHDEMLRIPLIIRLPGAVPAGRRIVEPVSVADVTPTVLDLLGLTPIEDADGMSLASLIFGGAQTLPRRGVFAEAESAPSMGWLDLAAVETRTHACLDDARQGTAECFDAAADPWQRGPGLADDDPSAGARDALALVRGFASTAAPPTRTGAGVSTEEFPARAVEVDPERRQQLRDLGYVE